MKRRLLLIIAIAAAAIAVMASPAFAVHSASCGWRTDGVQFFTPTYGEYPIYNGHTVINGLYYRAFRDYGWWGTYYYLHTSVVYCG